METTAGFTFDTSAAKSGSIGDTVAGAIGACVSAVAARTFTKPPSVLLPNKTATRNPRVAVQLKRQEST